MACPPGPRPIDAGSPAGRFALSGAAGAAGACGWHSPHRSHRRTAHLTPSSARSASTVPHDLSATRTPCAARPGGLAERLQGHQGPQTRDRRCTSRQHASHPPHAPVVASGCEDGREEALAHLVRATAALRPRTQQRELGRVEPAHSATLLRHWTATNGICIASHKAAAGAGAQGVCLQPSAALGQRGHRALSQRPALGRSGPHERCRGQP